MVSWHYAWNEDTPGAEIAGTKGKAAAMPATVQERLVRLWAGLQGVPARQSHSTMKIDVKGQDGQVVEWTFVGGRPGDETTVTIVPAIDGKSPIGLLSAITYADGHTVRFRSPDE